MQIKTKDVEVNGRTFRIKKFPARAGSFMLIKLTSILAPMFSTIKQSVVKSGGFNADDIDITGFMEQLMNMSEKDFNYIQEQALRVCFENLPGGLAPVLDANGSFGVQDIEDDTAMVMTLTVHALAFNLSNFFQGNALSGVMKGFLSSPQG